MNRPLCLLLLLAVSGCGAPQDAASVGEPTMATPDTAAAPPAQRKQSGPPTARASATDIREAAADNASGKNRNHNKEVMAQGQQTVGHVHTLETLGASAERNDQGEVVFLLLPLSSTITDENLAHLQELPKLQVLVLGNSRITDAGLVHLKGLLNLRELLLGDTQITDAGLVHLAGLTKLKILELNNTQITGAGLAALGELTQLEVLDVSYTQVGNSGLQHLVALRSLVRLGANYTRITDHGLPQLAALSSLTDLYLNDTQITKGAIAKFQQALPNCSNVKD